MKPVVTWLAILLLLFSSAIAAFAAYRVAAHPDGSTIRLTMDVLKDTPFKNFKIPGILFFISIGITGMVSIVLTIFQLWFHYRFIVACGVLLVMWIFLLMAFSPEISMIQYVLLFTGIAEVLCGLWLEKRNEE